MLSVIDTQRTLAVDFSSYQSRVDPALLRANGVSIPIIKCSSGTQEDKMFRTHATNCLKVYPRIGVYHWIDPTIGSFTQARFVVDLLLKLQYPIAFVMLDYEQWWANWSLWFQANQGKIPMSSVPRVDPNNLSIHAKSVVSTIKANSFRTVVYTGYGFYDSYTPQSKVWLANESTVIAAYPKQPAVRTLMEWPDLKQYYPTTLPRFIGSIVGHQFTGDRCRLPGVYQVNGGIESRSALDISTFDIAYLQSCGVACIPMGTTGVTPPVPIQPTKTVDVGLANVRVGSGTPTAAGVCTTNTNTVVGTRKLGDVVPVFETVNCYTRIGTGQWIFAAYLK
jgi:GH25 family lysozyme M1 (1,4-beta-N-acetylmuramidase)